MSGRRLAGLLALGALAGASILDGLAPPRDAFGGSGSHNLLSAHGNAHTSLGEKVKEVFHGHEDTVWEKLGKALGVKREPETLWDRLFGIPSKGPFEAFTDRMHAKAPKVSLTSTLKHYTSILAFSARLVWGVMWRFARSGMTMGLWTLDVLIFLVLYDQVRTLVYGPSFGKSLLSRVSRIVARTFSVILGRATNGAAGKERWLRIALASTVFLPLVLAGLFLLALPAMLFSIAVKAAIPTAAGITLVTLAHACTVPPLSWAVNPVLVEVLLYCWRVLGGFVLLFAAQRAGAAVKGNMREYRSYFGPQQQVRGSADAGVPAGPTPGPMRMQPMYTEPHISSHPVVGAVDRYSLLGDAFAQRVENAVEGLASKALGGSRGRSDAPAQAQWHPAQQQHALPQSQAHSSGGGYGTFQQPQAGYQQGYQQPAAYSSASGSESEGASDHEAQHRAEKRSEATQTAQGRSSESKPRRRSRRT